MASVEVQSTCMTLTNWVAALPVTQLRGQGVGKSLQGRSGLLDHLRAHGSPLVKGWGRGCSRLAGGGSGL